MRIGNCLTCLALCLFFTPSVGLTAQLTIIVRYPDKTPAKGIRVHEVQLERHRIYNRFIGATDNNGTINVEFEQKPRKDCKGKVPRGYGIYRYVIMPANYRWEISDIYYWNKEPYSNEVLHQTGVWPVEDYEKRMHKRKEVGLSPKSNWSRGRLVKVHPDSQIRWEVTLNKGKNVHVSVVDQFNEPVRNKKLSVLLDLDSLSHSGFGGEIPMFKVKTDAKGRFNLSHTGEFFYSFDLIRAYGSPGKKYCAPEAYCWTTRTKLKIEKDKEKILYHRCIGKIATFIVTDSQTGNPIAKAQVWPLISFTTCAQGGSLGFTDNNGVFTTNEFYTEHVLKFGVFKEGYKEWLVDIEQFVPGKTYMISLEPKSKE